MNPAGSGGLSRLATLAGDPLRAAGAATPAANGTLQRWTSQVPPWAVDLFQTVLVLVGAYVLSRVLVSTFGRRIARQFRRPSVTRTVLRALRVGVFVLALLTILNIYGLGLGDIALSVTVFSAVVGVVLAPIVGSVISGLFLLADQPYEIGDMIELADSNQRGYVEDITLRYTKIFTVDNTFLVVPNGAMRDRDVINYSAEDSRTRQSLQVLVTYESDVQLARELIEQSARQVDRVIEGGPSIRIGAARYPAAPTCYIDDYADHGVLLTLRYWVEEPYWLLRVRSKVQENLWSAMEGENVEIAYPHSHLLFDETSGTMRVSVEDGQGDGFVPGRRDEREVPTDREFPPDGARPDDADGGDSA